MHARDVDERRARMVLRQQQKDTDSQKRRKEAATDKDNKGPPEDSGQGEVKSDPAAVIKVNLTYEEKLKLYNYQNYSLFSKVFDKWVKSPQKWH